MTRHRFPPPAEWQAFEDLCHDLFKALWQTPMVDKHGRGGEAQDGVDLYGLLPDGSWCGVQCKEKGASKSLTRAEMRRELDKARDFNPRLARYVFATTAERSAKAQGWARELTESTPFEVTVMAWDDLCEALSGRPEIVERHFASILPTSVTDIVTQDAEEALDAFRRFHWSELLPLPSLAQARNQRHADLLLTDIYTALDVEAEVFVGPARADRDAPPGVDPIRGSTGLPGDPAYLEALVASQRALFDEADRQGRATARRRRCRAVEAAAANRRLVLVGSAGSGKSTFGRFLAACLLGESLGHSEASLDGLLQSSEGGFVAWPHGAPLALFVSLQKFQASTTFPAEGESGEARHLIRYLESLGPEASLPAFARGLGEALKRPNGALVILDGLDETPSAEASRVRLRQVICGFVRAYEGCRVLVTSRPYAYKSDSPWRLDDADFASVDLAPFDHGQQQAFVEAWYRRLVARRLLDVSTERQEAMARDLVSQIGREGYVANLAQSPLMLTMMADLHASNSGRLPSGGRAALYGESVALLLDRWNETREGTKPTEALGMSLDQIQEALQRLAFEVHRSRGVSDGETPEIQRGELWEALVQTRETHGHEGRVDDQEILRYLHQRSGILIGESERIYRFPHRSYQEYLAACYLVDGEDFPDLLDEVVSEDPALWREVVQLAVGATAKKKSMAWSIIEMLVPSPPLAEEPALDDPRFLRSVLAGLSVRETRLWQGASEANVEKLSRLRGWLRLAIELGALDIEDRAQAGQVLGLLGDDRPGVGVGEDGLPAVEWVEIPASTFVMGSERSKREGPVHDEKVEGFRITRYCVTNAQYRAFVDDGGYTDRWRDCWTDEGWEWNGEHSGPLRGRFPFDVSNHPRANVSWYEAVAFCRWLSAKTGESIRLPNESEWERAARGVDGREYPWGSKFDASLCNSSETGLVATTAVGLFPGGESPPGSRGVGILDASGNVWEWCSTKNRENYDTPADDDLEGSSVRVLRGGSYVDNDISARCAARLRLRPDGIHDSVGFRLVAPSLNR